MTHLGTIYADNLDPTKPKTNATTEALFCYVVNLPFRLRVGNNYAFSSSDDEDFKLYFRNPYKIPQEGIETDKLQEEIDTRGTYNFLWTKVLIVLKKPPNPSRAMVLLNNFIIAYSTVCQSTLSLFGQVKTLTSMEFSEAVESELQYHCPKGYTLTDSDVEKLINWKPPFTAQISGFPLFRFKDLPTQVVNRIPVAFTRHCNYIFYEFAFHAKVRIESEDHIGALLMACIALEGVHSMFLKQVRKDNAPTHKRKREKDLKKQKKASRESRFYERLRKTSSVYLDVKERPPDKLLERCEKAIRIRDEIMHAKYNNGTYMLRRHKTSELLDAYKAMTETYEYFKKALERRQEQNQLS
jgi:hypothetical protein